MSIPHVRVIDYGLTPAQYHAGLGKPWDALGVTGTQDEDVFTLAGREIKRLRAENESLLEELKQETQYCS